MLGWETMIWVRDEQPLAELIHDGRGALLSATRSVTQGSECNIAPLSTNNGQRGGR